jgi:hypothetical protein
VQIIILLCSICKKVVGCWFKVLGVLKTASKGYPKAQLNIVDLGERGDRYGLISDDEDGRPQNDVLCLE